MCVVLNLHLKRKIYICNINCSYCFPKMALLKYTQKLKFRPHHKQGDHAALKRNFVSQFNSALSWFHRHRMLNKTKKKKLGQISATTVYGKTNLLEHGDDGEYYAIAAT